MESFLLSVVMLGIGSVVGIGVSRHNATWVNRRNIAAEAFGAAVAVHSAMLSSLRLARQVEAELLASPRDGASISQIADSVDLYLRNQLDASKMRLDKLREARLSTQAIWGPHVALLFDDFFELTSAWHNALARYRDDIHGHFDPDEGPWDQDLTGFDWHSVIQSTGPHAELFEREFERLMALIRRFARAAGVAITDLHHLPQGVREVVDEYAEHREQRLLAVTRPAELPSSDPK